MFPETKATFLKKVGIFLQKCTNVIFFTKEVGLSIWEVSFFLGKSGSFV